MRAALSLNEAVSSASNISRQVSSNSASQRSNNAISMP